MTAEEERDLSVDLARRVRAARVLSGKKAPELARACGWSVEKLYKIEQGRQVPDALELVSLAVETGQSVEFFYGISSPSDPTLPDQPVAVKEGNE